MSDQYDEPIMKLISWLSVAAAVLVWGVILAVESRCQ